MNVIELTGLRSSAEAIGISGAEWAALRRTTHPDTLLFYLELRRTLVQEYAGHRRFHLPARQLAAQGFLPHRRDHKLYLRLVAELLEVGLIARVHKAGFSVEGRRTSAAFMFTRPADDPDEGVVFLANYRKPRVSSSSALK